MGGMISFTHSGDFDNTKRFLRNANRWKTSRLLKVCGERGVNALSEATPVATGRTAASWDYEIIITKSSVTVQWTNSNLSDGTPIAILIQYGHGTATGGYVRGRDYINPAIRPIFDEMADEIWEEVTK